MAILVSGTKPLQSLYKAFNPLFFYANLLIFLLVVIYSFNCLEREKKYPRSLIKMGSDVYKLDKLADYLIPDTSIIAINSHLIKPIYRKEIKNLKQLKLITYTLPVLSRYKQTAFNNQSLFSDEMKSCYEIMELCAVQIVTQIGAIINHTWKYGENASHVAEQFVFLFDSIFRGDLPLVSKLTNQQIRSFLLESFNDLYLHRQIQLIVHSIFLGLDKIELRNSIIEMLELKYGYEIPGHLFVVAVSSLGLQLYRNELERNHEHKIQKLNKVFRWKKIARAQSKEIRR